MVQFFGDYEAYAAEQVGDEVPVFSGAAAGRDVDGDSEELLVASAQEFCAVAAFVVGECLDLGHYLIEVTKDGDSIARDLCKSVVFHKNKDFFRIVNNPVDGWNNAYKLPVWVILIRRYLSFVGLVLVFVCSFKRIAKKPVYITADRLFHNSNLQMTTDA